MPTAVVAVFDPLPLEGLPEAQVFQVLAHFVFKGSPTLHCCCKFLPRGCWHSAMGKMGCHESMDLVDFSSILWVRPVLGVNDAVEG